MTYNTRLPHANPIFGRVWDLCMIGLGDDKEVGATGLPAAPTKGSQTMFAGLRKSSGGRTR